MDKNRACGVENDSYLGTSSLTMCWNDREPSPVSPSVPHSFIRATPRSPDAFACHQPRVANSTTSENCIHFRALGLSAPNGRLDLRMEGALIDRRNFPLCFWLRSSSRGSSQSRGVSGRPPRPRLDEADRFVGWFLTSDQSAICCLASSSVK